jgi:hypothetical protein
VLNLRYARKFDDHGWEIVNARKAMLEQCWTTWSARNSVIVRVRNSESYFNAFHSSFGRAFTNCPYLWCVRKAKVDFSCSVF